jgi:hypothetical protein
MRSQRRGSRRHRQVLSVRKLRFETLECRQMLAANILVVTDPASAGQQPDDNSLLDFLKAAGNTIDSDSGAFTTSLPTAAQLADVDLIVVSRATTSGNYTQGTEPQDWNALNKPLLLMSPFLARSSHWGWINSTNLPADQGAPANYLAFPNASNPFVSGQTTAYAAAGVQIDNLGSNAVPNGATTVATMTVSGTATAAIVDLPAGTTTFNSKGTLGARRVYFTMPDYPDKANQDFADVLTPNAKQIVLNIIDQIALPTGVLEAENATLLGPTVATNQTGFTGTGFADYGTTPGQYIEWQVNASQAGMYTLDFRYANGTAANQQLELSANGVVDQAALGFNPTSANTIWRHVVEQVALNAGSNLVRLTMNGTNAPNIDNLDVAYFGPIISIPTAPTDLIANVASSTQVNLFWTDNADNEASYTVERKLASGGSFAQIATLPASSTAYSSTGLSANTQYVYRVQAANTAGDSGYSNEANATTLPPGSTTPSVTSINPGPGATSVFLDPDIVATVSVPNGGINQATVNSSTVKLYPTGNPAAQIAAVLNTSGGGDIIVLRPGSNLAANMSYTFEVTSGLKDLSGAAFVPFLSTFTTGTQVSPTDASIQFQHVALTNVPTGQYTCVTIGPDGKLYAAGVTGNIYRWQILADGRLGTMETITSLRDANGGNRLLIGLTFDPSSTANSLIVWATHTYFAFSDAPDFTGKLTKLSGANLENVQDYLVHLPRSAVDHVTNQSAFGPDGALYFMQGSVSAMGAPDAAWAFRTEHLLNAAVLRFDPALWDATVNGPLDVNTEDADPYNPFAPGAPLTIYASGLRNAYDLVWASNGFLYVPTNGSAAGGNTPGTPTIPSGGLLPRIDSATNGAYTGPTVPALNNVSTQHDWLFRVVQNGYYGHPNPTRNEFVLNGGNPTSGADPAQVSEYPVGTLPDRNWKGFAYDFGLNYSPDGVIQYKYGGFGGALVGKLLVARFSSGDDLIVLEPGLNGDIVSSNDAIASFDGFNDPIDLVENPVNGFLYVSQYDRAGGQGTITLLRPQEPNVVANKSQLIFDEVRGGAASAAKTIAISNTGSSTLTLSGISITGADASLFSFSPSITTPANIGAGGSLNINIVFNPPAANPLGPKMANLHLVTNDPDTPTLDLYLGGLTTIGEEGDNEPSLQWILDTFRIPVNVGDTNVATGPIEGIVLPNSNNIARFVKAGPGVVSVETLAVFSGDTFAQPAGILGWYTSSSSLTELARYGSGDSGQHQEINPTVQSGVTDFDPGTASFGMYSQWPVYPGRTVYSENALNTFDTTTQKHIVFALRDISGNVVPNAYIVGVEEAANNDFQDLVYIIRNVAPFVPGVAGDFNANNTVDAGDYILWRKNLGQSIALPNENVTPGMVTQDDYDTWRANFGAPAAGGQSLSAFATTPPSAPVAQDEVKNAAIKAAFASLEQRAVTNGAEESILSLFLDRAGWFSRRPVRRSTIAQRDQQIGISTVPDLDNSSIVPHRRLKYAAADVNDFGACEDSSPIDEALGEFGGDLQAPMLLIHFDESSR